MDDGWVSWVLLSGANSLVREKKDINTDKQVQSQTQAVPTAGAPGVMQEILPTSTPKFSTPRCPRSAILQASAHLKTFEHLIHQVLDLVLTELHPHDLLQVCLHEGHHQVAARHEGLVNGPKSHPALGLSSELGRGAGAEQGPER